MKTFNVKDFKKEVKNQFGSIKGLKKFLKDNAKNQYGCDTSETQIYGCRVAYTSNPNHWAEYFIMIPHVGFASTKALDINSITKAGKSRGLGYNDILI